MSKEVLNTQLFMVEHKATHEDFDDARKALYKMGIKMSYGTDKAIFTSTFSQKNTLSNVYVQECNGLILERGTWRPLMVPPRSLRSAIDTVASNKFMYQKLYHVYKAEDGTCFNMYWHNNKWNISTARGYEMNNVQWGKKTYQTIVDECLSIHGMTWETFTSKLDKNTCYSLGFKHPDFHKFVTKSHSTHKLWFIQSIILDPNSERYLWASDNSPVEEIKGQEYYTGTVDSLKDLYALATQSMDKFLSHGDVCYGFILRSSNIEITGAHSDLFVESALMRTIRQIWYDNNMINKCRQNNWDKDLAICLNAFLTNKLHQTFNIMFPSEALKFEQFSNVISSVTHKMSTLASNQDCDNTEPTNKINKVALHLLALFNKHVKYDTANKTQETLHKTFHEFAIHPSNLEIFIGLFDKE